MSCPSLAGLYINSGSLVGCQRFSSLGPGQDRQEFPYRVLLLDIDGAKESIPNQSNSTLYGGDTVPWWEIPMENAGKADKNPQLTFDVCSFQMQNV